MKEGIYWGLPPDKYFVRLESLTYEVIGKPDFCVLGYLVER